MRKPRVATSITPSGGIFKFHEVRGDFTLETPAAPIPIRHITRRDTVADSTRELCEVYVRLSAADLDAYKKDHSTNTIEKLEKVQRHRREDDIVVVFCEYTESQALDYVQMQIYVELQAEYSDIITFPCLPLLSDTLSPHFEGLPEFTTHGQSTPYGSLARMAEQFIEIVEDDSFEQHVMGVIPAAREGVRNNLFHRFVVDHGFRFVAMDFRGLKVTKDEELDLLEGFLKAAANKTRLEGIVLYALNYLPYYSYDRSLLPFEALTLVRLGFDITGWNHVSRGGGGDGTVTDHKIVEPQSLGVRKVDKDSIITEWPVGSTIPPDRFEQVNERKQGKLRKLVNAEATVSIFQDLRDAHESGTVRDFVTSKRGTTSNQNNLAERFERAYKDAIGRDLT